MTIEALRAALSDARKLPARERRKEGRTLGHMAMVLEQAGALSDPSDMDCAIKALSLGASSHSYPQRYLMARTRLMKKRRECLNLPDPTLLLDKARSLDVEMGSVVLIDAQRAISDLAFSAAWHKDMNAEGFFAVGLGGDGTCKVRVRLLAPGPFEPMATDFNKMREATEVGHIRCPSGTLKVTGAGRKELTLPDIPPLLQVMAFGRGLGRNAEVLVLLQALEGSAERPLLSEMPELQL